MKQTEQKKLELNSLMICVKHLTDQYITIEALKDSPELSKTRAQQAIWDALNTLGKAEIELDEEISNELSNTKGE